MAAFTVIDHTELTGTTNSIEFTSISGSYDHLYIEASLRTDSSDTPRNGMLQLGNGSVDTGTNYSDTQLYAQTATPASSQPTGETYMSGFKIVGTDGLADTFTSATFWIPNYANTANFKQVVVSGVCPNNSTSDNEWHVGVSAGLWSATSAVDVVKISCFPTADLVQYSTSTLYGVTGA